MSASGKRTGIRLARLAGTTLFFHASGSYRKNEQLSQFTSSPFLASITVCGEFFILQFEQLPLRIVPTGLPYPEASILRYGSRNFGWTFFAYSAESFSFSAISFTMASLRESSSRTSAWTVRPVAL